VDSGDEVIEEGFTTTVPQTAAAPVSISSPPAYSSKPDSLNHIYLDFNGGNVPGTTSWGGPAAGWDCYPYSLDTNYDEFSDDEQAAIKSIYQRVAEDYAPFDVNVTTDKQYDPDIYTGNKNQVGWVMITTNQDENGEDTPAQSGGRAYLGVFGESNYASSYQPAWITYNSLSGGNESVVAEAASHEMGHNMGLSHDGDSSDIYYEGHGSVTDVADSWGPIMGNSYGENVTQWSKGEYYDSKYHDWNENSYDVIANTQDDLAVISSRVPYRTDDHLAITGGATALVSLAGTISSTTPATDPTNASPENKGIIEMNTDVDVFTFFTGAGNINLSVDPWKVPGKTGNGNISYGGNLDVLIELRDLAGTLIASSVNTPGITGEMTNASISATVGQGNYFLHVKNSGAGLPQAASPSGYTSYGSIGQYFISGSIIDAASPPRILSSTPTYTNPISPPLSEMVFSFSKPMNPASFSVEADVLSFTGPSGVNLVPAITGAVWSNSNSTLTISFSTQTSIGYYLLTLSPKISDAYGNYCDQDLDSNIAEVIDDYYTSTVLIGDTGVVDTIWSDLVGGDDSASGWGTGYYNGSPYSWAYGVPTSNPNSAYDGTRIQATNLGGDYISGEWSYRSTPYIDTSGYSGVTLTFKGWKGVGEGDELYIEVKDSGGTWHKVYQFMGPSGGSTDSAWTTHDVDLLGYADDHSTLELRWGLRDSTGSPTATGWQIDAIVLKGVLGQAPPAPKVIDHSPINTVAGSQSSLWLEFSQPMDSGGFALSDIASFTGPSGSITASGFSWVNNSLLRIDFPAQSAVGNYSLALSELVPDTIDQNLDQDGDGTPGEVSDDTYTATFSINSYSAWSGSVSSSVDSNGDGLDNGIAWALGASNISTNNISLLPLHDNTSDADYFIYTYRRSAAAYSDPKTSIDAEYGSNLSGWTTVSENGSDVLVSEIRNGYGTGIDKVEVKVKKNLAVGDKLFTRLKVVITP
jgi:hypothetical protein